MPHNIGIFSTRGVLCPQLNGRGNAVMKNLKLFQKLLCFCKQFNTLISELAPYTLNAYKP